MTPPRENGFSLIELLIVTALIATLAAIAIPSMAGAMGRYALINASQQVVSTIRSARVQAVGKNRAARVRFNFPAAGQYQILDSADAAIVGSSVQALPNGATFGAISGPVQFDVAGRATHVGGAALPVTIVVTNGTQNRTITILGSGRVLLP